MSAFVIKVKTDNAGTSASDQFTLPGNSSYSYNFDVDWGDGSPVETINTGSSWTHTFTGGAGTYSVSITENVAGGFPAILFNNGGDKAKLLEIEQWGTNRWDTFIQACYGCSNLTITATDEGTADTGGVTTFQQAFQNCSSLTSFPLIDTSGALNFGAAWFGCSSLTSFPLIDASSVTNFGSAWNGCSSLAAFPLINTSSGTSFQSTWQGCSSLTSFPLLDFSLLANGVNTFLNVTLDTASYDAILANSFANNVNNSVAFHGGNSKYAESGKAVRDVLTAAPRSWTITDGGFEPGLLSTGLQGWWCPSLDTAGNGTNTLTDLSSNGNNGTLTNMDAATDWVADTTAGGVRALDFTPNGEFVNLDLAAAILDGVPQWSVLCWYQPRSVPIGFNESPFGDSLSYFRCFPTIRFRSGLTEFFAGNNLGFWLNEDLVETPTANWQCMLLSYDGEVVKVHLQGTLAATFDVDDSQLILANSLRLGGGGSASARSFDGLIDGFAAWSIDQSDQAEAIYNGGRSLNLLASGGSNIAHVLRSIQQQHESVVTL